MMKLICCSSLFAALTLACNAQTPSRPEIVPPAVASGTIADRYYAQSASLDQQVVAVYQAMSNRERAAQMIMVASSEQLGYPYATTVKPAVSAQYAANILLLKGTVKEFKKQHDELMRYQTGGLNPLFACDCEPTLLHNKFVGEPKMLATARLKTEEAVRASVDTINQLMDEMGIQINFAPIVDIAKNTSIINKRSFGNDPEQIAQQAAYFIDQTQKDGKAATIKHFPGHGAVSGDTHKQSVYINGKMTEYNTFLEVMQTAHPVFVMVGHISVKNNPDGYNTESGRPATTSRRIVTDLLRDKSGFRGIITTDAMNMQASKTFPDADWEAAKAGVDLILMPADPAALNRKIAAELAKDTELSRQLEASVKRIIRLKLIAQ